jgi:hypothetical protein
MLIDEWADFAGGCARLIGEWADFAGECARLIGEWANFAGSSRSFAGAEALVKRSFDLFGEFIGEIAAAAAAWAGETVAAADSIRNLTASTFEMASQLPAPFHCRSGV